MIHITYFHKRESVVLKYSNDSESLIEYPNNMVDINKNTDEQNSNEKHKLLTVFYDMLTSKKFQLIVAELFIRSAKINIVFPRQSYFVVPKNIELNTRDYFITKIPENESCNKLLSIICLILTLRTG